VLFCLKEEQLQHLIEQLTSDVENAKTLIDKLK
jgi:hypothetical protein